MSFFFSFLYLPICSIFQQFRFFPFFLSPFFLSFFPVVSATHVSDSKRSQIFHHIIRLLCWHFGYLSFSSILIPFVVVFVPCRTCAAYMLSSIWQWSYVCGSCLNFAFYSPTVLFQDILNSFFLSFSLACCRVYIFGFAIFRIHAVLVSISLLFYAATALFFSIVPLVPGIHIISM